MLEIINNLRKRLPTTTTNLSNLSKIEMLDIKKGIARYLFTDHDRLIEKYNLPQFHSDNYKRKITTGTTGLGGVWYDHNQLYRDMIDYYRDSLNATVTLPLTPSMIVELKRIAWHKTGYTQVSVQHVYGTQHEMVIESFNRQDTSIERMTRTFDHDQPISFSVKFSRDGFAVFNTFTNDEIDHTGTMTISPVDLRIDLPFFRQYMIGDTL